VLLSATLILLRTEKLLGVCFWWWKVRPVVQNADRSGTASQVVVVVVVV
jgi:hypothetical protein